MGYRGFDRLGIEPRFCFGHGLTYTTFDWSDRCSPRRPSRSRGSRRATTSRSRSRSRTPVHVSRAEVVQCYVHDVASTVTRPEQELRGFAKVELGTGRVRTGRHPARPAELRDVGRRELGVDRGARRRSRSAWVRRAATSAASRRSRSPTERGHSPTSPTSAASEASIRRTSGSGRPRTPLSSSPWTSTTKPSPSSMSSWSSRR